MRRTAIQKSKKLRRQMIFTVLDILPQHAPTIMLMTAVRVSHAILPVDTAELPILHAKLGITTNSF